MTDNSTNETIATADDFGGMTVPVQAPELVRFLPRLIEGKWVNFMAGCHDDRNPSLGMRLERNRVRIRCWAGCDLEGVVVCFPDTDPDSCTQRGAGGGSGRPQHISGCTLEQLAAAKGLNLQLLKHVGMQTVRSAAYDQPAVLIPYCDPCGRVLARQYRVSLDGDRFRWASGDVPVLYGLHCLDWQANRGRSIWLVEGCTDVLSLYQHGLAAVGVPGSNNWREEWRSLFKGISTILAVIEPDAGGRALKATLEQTNLPITFVEPPNGCKDITDAFMRGWDGEL